jgi:hypothetical protein
VTYQSSKFALKSKSRAIVGIPTVTSPASRELMPVITVTLVMTMIVLLLETSLSSSGFAVAVAVAGAFWDVARVIRPWEGRAGDTARVIDIDGVADDAECSVDRATDSG